MFMLGAGMFLLLTPLSRRRLAWSSDAVVARGRSSDVAALVLGAGIAVVVGGLGGALAGVVVAAGARWALQQVGSGDGGRAKQIARQAPDAVDCLAACLAAGAELWTAMEVVADAFGEPMRAVLRRAVTRHWLGSAYSDTLAEMLDEPSLAAVGRVLLRSVESGAGAARALAAGADQMRRDRTAELERRARGLGVKAVAPLGLCFLPAFVVVAVVPIVGSLLKDLF